MRKITFPGKMLTLVSAFIFSTIVFSTASTSDLAELTISEVDVQNVSCPGDQTGKITVTVSGGTGLYSYEWTYKNDGSTYNTTEGTLSNLSAGIYEVYITDENGDSGTSDPIEVIVADSEAPVITATDISVDADADSCFASAVVFNVSATDNCSVGDPVGTRDDGLALTNPFPVGETLITWNVTDDNGNTADTVTQIITVADKELPNALAKDITVQLDASGNIQVAPAEVDNGSSDNCSFFFSLSQTTFDCSNLGENPVTLTVTDGSGNSSTAELIITVEDTVPPVITAEDLTVPTDSSSCEATITDPATASDNCGTATLTGIRSDGLPLTDPYEVGTTTITWTATDALGNTTSDVVQTITVEDQEAPVIAFAESITWENTDDTCETSVPVYKPAATDNCSVGEPVGTRDDGKAVTAKYPVGTTVITWNVTDVNDNHAEPVKQVITVIDIVSPVAPTLEDIYTSCEITLTPPQTTDNCTPTDQILVTTDDPVTYKPQNNVTEHIITWRFEDADGNITFADQKLVITPLFLSLTASHITCHGGSDGSIAIQAEGGEPPYLYALDNGTFGSNSNFTGLTAGIYIAKVKDNSGCVASEEIEITQPDALQYTPPADGVVATTTAESCFEAYDGIIEINGTITGGTGVYEYSVDNINFSSNPITGLTSGEYEIFIQDTNGCRLPQVLNATVEGPDILSAELKKTDASCYATNSGSIEVSNPSGGNTTPYSFRLNGGTWQTNSTPTGYTFSNLSAGTYEVEMKDASGCIRMLDTITLLQPDQLVPNISTTRTTTYGSATGTASASPTGGNGMYTYQWKDAAGNLIANTQSITGLVAGDYELTVTDGLGCKVVEPFIIIDKITTEISAISLCENTDDTIRTSTFAVDIDKTMGGVGEPHKFTYVWDFGEGASLPSGTTGMGPHKVTYSSTGDKVITLTVTDLSGSSIVYTSGHYVGACFEECDSANNFSSHPDSFYIGDADGTKMVTSQCDSNEPMYLWFIVDKSANGYILNSEFVYTVTSGSTTRQYQATNCYSNADGSQLQQGQLVRLNQVGTEENQIHWTCDEVLNIIHITYRWTVNEGKSCGQTNNNHCASTNETMSVAAPIRGYAEATGTCFGQRNGSIIIDAYGGTNDFTYQAVHDTTGEVFTSSINVINNLPGGTYTVTITDNKDVAEGQEVNYYIITNIVVEEADSALTAEVRKQDISCYGAKDGWAEAFHVEGGTPFNIEESTPQIEDDKEVYQYLWNDALGQTTPKAVDLGPGTYTVTITDSVGCSIVKEVVITQPAQVTPANAGADQTRCGFTTTTLEGNTPVVGTGQWAIEQQPSGSTPVITDPTSPTTTFTATEGEYVLSWTISNADGSCYSTDTVTIKVIEQCNFLDFDGLNDYITFGTEPYNFDAGAFSMEAWVKLKTTSGTRTVLSKRDISSSLNPGYELLITSGGVPAFRTAAVNLAPNSAFPLNTQRWYHLAVTFDGSSLKLFVDGLQVNSITTSNPGVTSAPFYIGATYDSSYTTSTKPTSHFNGWIEEVRLWKKALTPQQIRFMMNQRLEKVDAEIEGTVVNNVVKGKELPLPVPGPLAWSELSGYYQLIALDAADSDGTTPDLSNTPVSGVLKNITTFQENTAPLPYVSKRDGNWRDIEASTTPWLYGRGRWDAPNSQGINSQPINWNIVRTSHDIVSGNGNITVLGLLSEAGEISVSDPNKAKDEYNAGHSLRVTHYLRLNGTIDLIGESQLLQDEGSILEEASTGYLKRDQQGTASSYNYNYWSSPVSPTGGANNAPYTVKSVVRDGTDPANPGLLSFNYQYHWADHNYTGNKRISTYWLYTYTNFKSNTYSEWHYVGENGAIKAGEGFTMKGTSGSAKITDRQNYTFIGKPNNGTIKHEVSPGNDYLVGNPYPSAIDSWEFIRDNIKDGGRRDENIFNGTLYFWDHFAGKTHYLQRYVGGYATLNLAGGIEAVATDERINATGQSADKALNPKRFIPVGQAFYVSTQVDSELSGLTEVTGGEIRFKNSQRVFETEHQIDDESIFKSKEEKQAKKEKSDTRSKVYLRYSSPEGFHRQILVTRDPNTSKGFDLGYDAPLIEDIDEDMYWMIHKVGFVIQAVPEFDSTTELPLTVKLHEEGEFTIAIDKLENIPEDLPIHLKDTLNDTTHDLRKSPFKLTEEGGSMAGRFKLVFPLKEVVEETTEGDTTSIHSYYSNKESKVTIENPFMVPIQEATLYNINGQKLREFRDIPQEKIIELKIDRRASGVYIMKLDMGTETKSVKFIVE